MRPWLLAALVTTILVPSAALLVQGREHLNTQTTRARVARADAYFDIPSRPRGLFENPLITVEAVRGQPVVARARGILTAPALLGNGERRRLVRLEGHGRSALPAFERLAVASDGSLSKRRSLAVGRQLAQDLDLAPGDQVSALALAPGPEALGFRRTTFTITTVMRSGLELFDRDVAITNIDQADALLGAGNRLNGARLWLTETLPPEEAQQRLSRSLHDDQRARPLRLRDRPATDATAALALGHSTLLLVLIVAFLALPAVGLKRGWAYHAVLRAAAPTAGVAVFTSLAAAAALVAFLDGDGWSTLLAARADLGRLFFVVVLGLLASPLLAGRLDRTGAAVALAALIALATVEPAGSAVVASGTARRAARLTEAARSAGQLVATGPLDAALGYGGEVAPVELVGVDPTSAEVTKLLEVLCDGAEVTLRRSEAKRPTPWTAGIALDDVFAQLAAHGDPTKLGGGGAASAGEPPALVLGSDVARRLGVGVGDEITLAAAPAEVSAEGELDPPWPRSFRVAAIAQLGLQSVDERLAIADTWQLEALGAEGAAPGPFVLPPDLASQSSEPFSRRARQAAIASALQIGLLAFLLGGALTSFDRKAWRMLAIWGAVGLVAGAVLGFSEGAGGLIEIGDPSWYETLPRGRALLSDLVSPWSALPAMTAILAAIAGLVVARRR